MRGDFSSFAVVAVGIGLKASVALGGVGDDPSAGPVPFPHPLITEVLYAVPTGEQGDANGDGVRQTNGDEFIELINPHERPISLKGYRLRDAAGMNPSEKGLGKLDFIFPACELAPGQMAVVFNGFDATWQGPVGDRSAAPKAGNERFGGALVFSMKVGSSKTGLANKGDFVVVSSPEGVPVHAVSWGDRGGGKGDEPGDGKNPEKAKEGAKSAGPPKETLLIDRAPVVSNKSVERRGISGAFAEVAADQPFTPGVFAGARTVAADPGRTREAVKPKEPKPVTDAKAKAKPVLAPTISELLVDLPARADADKDGKPDASGDQFVELVNPHEEAIDLKGVVVESGAGDAAIWRCELPAISLKPGEVVVIFNQAADPKRKIPASATPGSGPEGDAALKPNARFAGAYVLAAGSATPEAKVMSKAAGWVTIAVAGLVVEAAWWGETPPSGSGVLTAEAIEQVVLDPETPGSVRKRPASGDFEAHPNHGGVRFSPGRSEFRAGK